LLEFDVDTTRRLDLGLAIGEQERMLPGEGWIGRDAARDTVGRALEPELDVSVLRPRGHRQCHRNGSEREILGNGHALVLPVAVDAWTPYIDRTAPSVVAAQQPVGEARDRAVQQRRHPEQPELRQRCAAYEQRRRR